MQDLAARVVAGIRDPGVLNEIGSRRGVLVPVVVATAAAAIAVVVAVLPSMGGAADPGSAGAPAPNVQGPTTTQDPDQQQAAQHLG